MLPIFRTPLMRLGDGRVRFNRLNWDFSETAGQRVSDFSGSGHYGMIVL